MIISKTPYRISFFGGGTDYPQWYKKFGGEVISTTIDKYVYITIRPLPSFFKHKYRIVYSKQEVTKKLSKIKHKPVKAIIKYFKIKYGLEIHYDGDLPAKSGVGSSSAFVVGLIKAMIKLKKLKINKPNLAKKSIMIEAKILKEVVGSQDQVACAYGGFNNIIFKKNGTFLVKKINIKKKNIKLLENNLFLVFSKIQRTAQIVAKSFVNRITNEKIIEMQKINSLVSDAKRILKTNNIDKFGELLNESWKFKKKLSVMVSNDRLDKLYEYALRSGASGGKLLGAGGGGFFVFYVKKNHHKKFLIKMKKTLIIPFRFETNGSKSEII